MYSQVSNKGQICYCDFIEPNNKTRIDFILASGDLTNMKPEDNSDSELVRENEQEVRKVLQALHDIHPLVYFIPGNVMSICYHYLSHN